MEIQNLEDGTRTQHYRPCPPSYPVPQFPQKNKILLGCPPWSSTKSLDQRMRQHRAWALPANRPWQGCPRLSLTPTVPSMGSSVCPHHGQLSESQHTFGSKADPWGCRVGAAVGSTQARLRPGGAGTRCLNVNTSFIHLDWLSSAMLCYT